MNILDGLQERLAAVLRSLEATTMYRDLLGDRPDGALLTSMMREVYRDIATYQPHVTEATFTAVGRMPKRENLIRTMILQQVEEVEHAAMARRDFDALQGPERDLAQLSPEAAAVAAVCRFLGEHCHPASYLGYMFIFEALTPVMAARIQSAMAAQHMSPSAREFVDLHAVEDIRHTDQVLQMVEEIVKVDDAAGTAILWGCDVFTAVYPLPLWEAGYERAKTSLACHA